MLKRLLGHWKAHKKKPSLLPEDGDIHFEEPQTINPLYEDSDSSISSNQKPTDSKSGEQTQTLSQIDNEQTENENVPVVSELVDVSSPTHSKDKVISDNSVSENKITDSVKDDNSERTEEITPKSDNSNFNKRSKKLEEKPAENLEINKLEKPKIDERSKILEEKPAENLEINKLEKPKIDEKSKTVDHNFYLQKPISLESSSHETAINKISPKDKTDVAEISETENMRIYNQPSTSAIRESKNPSDITFSEKEKTHIPSSKSADVKNTDQIKTKQSKTLVKKDDSISNGDFQPISPLKQFKENSSFLFSKQPKQLEKPAKLRARAIDELIKKFQSPDAESNDETSNILDGDSKYSLDESSAREKTINSVSETETKTSSSLSNGVSKVTNKVSKPDKKELTKTSSSVVETNLPHKNSHVEPISNIFKFPPPPPIEKLQNESNLHDKFAKESKFKKLSSSPNKIKEKGTSLTEDNTGKTKTRSDTSLDRTRTASSYETINHAENLEDTTIQTQYKEPPPLPSNNSANGIKEAASGNIDIKESKRANETSVKSKTLKENKFTVSKVEDLVENKTETKVTTSQDTKSTTSVKKELTESNQTNENPTSFLHKSLASNSNNQETAHKTSTQLRKSSISKASSKPLSVNDNDNVKSHSEDSGITRGDQISSEATQEPPAENPPDEASAVPNAPRKHKKEKKSKTVNKKNCKHCKHNHNDSISLKRSLYDDYYDNLTGARHSHRGKHSDSWTSDLSWEEREFLRRLRSKKGTVRSNAPSTRSRLSKHRFIDENYFRRHHNFRRSVSDESSFYGASLCSCDECWAHYLKDYAYGRASLRGMSPIQEMCTCQNSRHNFLGRRVQFQPDIIHEAAPSEKTATTTASPVPPTEKKEENETDDKSSQKSVKSKNAESVSTHPDGIKDKKSKIAGETYRLMTPWELEEWDLLMRKHLLHKRRKRARCMGLMALAMVVFVGLVVAILMVYLRRKVI